MNACKASQACLPLPPAPHQHGIAPGLPQHPGSTDTRDPVLAGRTLWSARGPITQVNSKFTERLLAQNKPEPVCTWHRHCCPCSCNSFAECPPTTFSTHHAAIDRKQHPEPTLKVPIRGSSHSSPNVHGQSCGWMLYLIKVVFGHSLAAAC